MKHPDRYSFLGLVPLPCWPRLRGIPGVVRDILDQDTGTLYLRRVYLLPWVYLHLIAAPDRARDPHDHPWKWAWSYVLTGGYVEARGLVVPWHRWVGRGATNYLSSRTYHKIVSVDRNTWTLFVTGPRTKSWGFMTERGHVDYKEYRT